VRLRRLGPQLLVGEELRECPHAPLRRGVDGDALLVHLEGLLALDLGPPAEHDELALARHDVRCAVDGVAEDHHARVVVRLRLGDRL